MVKYQDGVDGLGQGSPKWISTTVPHEQDAHDRPPGDPEYSSRQALRHPDLSYSLKVGLRDASECNGNARLIQAAPRALYYVGNTLLATATSWRFLNIGQYRRAARPGYISHNVRLGFDTATSRIASI